jgi:hypothetical protein
MLWATTPTSSSSARYLGSKSSAGSTPSSGDGCSTTRLSRSRAATNRLAEAVDSGDRSTPAAPSPRCTRSSRLWVVAVSRFSITGSS